MEISGTAYGARASASVGYKEMERSISESGEIYAQSMIECSLYSASFDIQSQTAPGVLSNFADAVAALPSKDGNGVRSAFVGKLSIMSLFLKHCEHPGF